MMKERLRRAPWRLLCLLGLALSLALPASADTFTIHRGGSSSATLEVNPSGNDFVSPPMQVASNGDWFYITGAGKTWYGEAVSDRNLANHIGSGSAISYVGQGGSQDYTLYWNGEACTIKLHFSYNNDNIYNVYAVKVNTELAEGYPRYYLLSNTLNDYVASPDYELIPSGSAYSTRSAIAYRCGDTYKVSKYYNPEYWEDITLSVTAPSGINGSGTQPGWGAKPVFNPSDATLVFEPLHQGGSIAKDIFPYVGIVSGSFFQPDNYSTCTSDKKADTVGQTEFGWQEAFIQMDAKNNVLTNPSVFRIINGVNTQGAYYSTIWPPRNNISMVAKPDKDDSSTWLNVSSEKSAFTPARTATGDIEVKNGSVWVSELRAVDPSGYNNLTLDANTTYARYTATDLWMTGEFKLWTGWNGEFVDNHANWDNHTFFGPGGDAQEQSATKEKNLTITTHATYNAYNKAGGNYRLSAPTYMKDVELFIPMTVSADGVPAYNAATSRLYLIEALGDAKIMADKGTLSGEADHGFYLPKLDFAKMSGHSVKNFRVVRADATVSLSDKDKWQPVGADGQSTTVDDATVLSYNLDGASQNLATQQAFDALIQAAGSSASMPTYVHDAKLGPGAYFYYFEVEFDNGAREKVSSAPFYIYATTCTADYEAYQLVKLNADDSDDAYVTYRKGSSTIYDVHVDAQGQVTSFARRAGGFDYDQGYFTSKVLLITYLPRLFTEAKASYRAVESFKVKTAPDAQTAPAASDPEVGDLTQYANAYITAGTTGQPLYVLVDAPNLTQDNLKRAFYLEFTGKTSFTGGDDASAWQQMTIADEAKTRKACTLTFPYYTMGEGQVSVTHESNQNQNATVTSDAFTGETATVSVPQGAPVNAMTLTLPFRKPMVYPLATRTALKSLFRDVKLHSTKGYVYDLSFDPDNDADLTLTLTNADPSDYITLQAPASSTGATQQLDIAQPEHMEVLNGNTEVHESISAVSASRSWTATVYRAYEETAPNVWTERLVMVKPQITVADQDAVASSQLNYDQDAQQYLVTYTVGGESIKHYAKAQASGSLGRKNIEDNIIILDEKVRGHWWDGMTDYPATGVDQSGRSSSMTLSLQAIHYFKGGAALSGDGISIVTPAHPIEDAPRRAAADGSEPDSYYTLLSSPATFTTGMILTDAPEILASERAYAAGSDYIELLKDGVRVINAGGIVVASAPGRYTLPAGVYVVAQGEHCSTVLLR